MKLPKLDGKRAKLVEAIGMGVARTIIPGVPAMEMAVDIFRNGGEKAEAVDKMVLGGLDMADWLTNLELLEDPEFREGVKLYREGTVKIMHAVQRLQDKEEKR